MAAITSSGIGSGLNLSDILDQLRTSENTKLTAITDKQTANKSKISGYGTVSSALSKLQTALRALGSTGAFKANTVAFNGTGVTATATTASIPGAYSVKVNAVAKAHSMATTGYASKSDAIIGSGTLTLQSGTGTPVTINIAEGSSLTDISSQINSAGLNIQASIVNVGGANPYRLSITAKNSGTDNAIVQSFTGTGDVAALMGSMSTITDAANAELEVNGMSIVSASNQVTEAIPGVTLNVASVGAAQTMTVAQDTTAVTKAINDFVSAFNSYKSAMTSLTKYDSDTKTAGILIGDSTLSNIQQRITTQITTQLAGNDGGITLMNQLGIRLQTDGTMAVDNTKLTDALANNPEGVQRFFAGTGNMGSDGLVYRFNKVLDTLLKEDGPLTLASNSLTETNKRLDKTYEQQSTLIDAYMDRMTKQFNAMDSLVSQWNSTGSYLTSQFAAMNKSTS